MIHYLEQCAPAVAKIREALEKPYYLLPINWPEFKDWDARNVEVGKKGVVLPLSVILAACARNAARAGNDDGAEAFLYLFDIVRLARMLGTDVEMLDSILLLGRHVAPNMREVARAASPEVLRNTLRDWEGLRRDFPSPASCLELQWRIIDHTEKMSSMMHHPEQKDEQMFNHLAFGAYFERVRRRIVRNREQYLKAVALSYPDYQKWLQQHPELTYREGMMDPIDLVNIVVTNQAILEAYYGGAELVMNPAQFLLHFGVGSHRR